MEHFIRVVMEKQKEPKLLDESIFESQAIYESAQGATVFQIELPKQLSEHESDEYAANLANMMFEAGYSDFDIEVSAGDELDETDEVTYEDDDEFYEDYGVMWYNEDDQIDEAEYQGRNVKLGKPMAGDVKKFKVYVKNPNGNVVKVNFGQKGVKIKKSNPARRRSFRARHNCDNPGPRHKARYWSCRKW
jgi:hypothetical protein|tara:strand:+ start:5200 stop:5769 length:570 start_codon:yes stop_codon:yes gene_type:complete